VPAPLERLVGLVKRELPARDAGVVSPAEAAPDDDRTVRVPLSRGWGLWASGPEGALREAAREKRAQLVESFEGLIDDALQHARVVRPDPERELGSILRDTEERLGEEDALVLDTHSPMVWGSASGLHGEALAHPRRVVVQGGHSPAPSPRSERSSLSRKAISEVMALPQIARLARGAHLRRAEADDQLGWLVHAFASIYLLVGVFRGTFDEVKAEREVVRVLPSIERWVLSLPPPSDSGGAAAGARGRRR